MFGKHSEKIQRVVGERPNISLALCSKVQLRVKKKLIEGPFGQLRIIIPIRIIPYRLIGVSTHSFKKKKQAKNALYHTVHSIVTMF